MASRKKKLTSESTRECILRSAKKVFSLVGFEGASVKAIATEANSNVALVSYYFGGKEGLYQACLEEFGKSRKIAFHTILTPPQSASDFRFKLRLWMESFFQANLEDPEIVRIFHREIVEELRMERTIFEKYFLRLFDDVIEFIEKARKGGFIRKDVDPYFAATLLLGAMGDVVRMDPIRKMFHKRSIGSEKFRNELIDQYLEFFMTGMMKTKEPARGGR